MSIENVMHLVVRAAIVDAGGCLITDRKAAAASVYASSFKTRGMPNSTNRTRRSRSRTASCVAPAKIPTFKAAAELWYASKTDRRPAHVADLRSRLDKHILPRIGTMRLDRIKVGAIEKLRDDMQGDGYAPRTINAIIRIVGAVFRSAINRDETVRNPVDRIERVFMAARELRPGEKESDSNDDTVPQNADRC